MGRPQEHAALLSSIDPELQAHVLPILRSKCAPCHIPGETLTRLVTRSDIEGTPITHYSDSLDLTSYGGSVVTVGGTVWSKRGARVGAFWTRSDLDY